MLVAECAFSCVAIECVLADQVHAPPIHADSQAMGKAKAQAPRLRFARDKLYLTSYTPVQPNLSSGRLTVLSLSLFLSLSLSFSLSRTHFSLPLSLTRLSHQVFLLLRPLAREPGRRGRALCEAPLAVVHLALAPLLQPEPIGPRQPPQRRWLRPLRDRVAVVDRVPPALVQRPGRPDRARLAGRGRRLVHDHGAGRVEHRAVPPVGVVDGGPGPAPAALPHHIVHACHEHGHGHGPAQAQGRALVHRAQPSPETPWHTCAGIQRVGARAAFATIATVATVSTIAVTTPLLWAIKRETAPTVDTGTSTAAGTAAATTATAASSPGVAETVVAGAGAAVELTAGSATPPPGASITEPVAPARTIASNDAKSLQAAQRLAPRSVSLGIWSHAQSALRPIGLVSQ